MYNVAINAVNHDAIARAHNVVAFSGSSMYIVKSRSSILPIEHPPCKPDLVIGYYTAPTPHVHEIKLRERKIES